MGVHLRPPTLEVIVRRVPPLISARDGMATLATTLAVAQAVSALLSAQ